MVCLKVKLFLVTQPSFLQDASNQLSPETDVYDNVPKQQLYADMSDEISINSLHESSQSGQDSQTDSSHHAVHKESSEAPHSNIVLADSTLASGPEESSSFQQMTLDSKAGGTISHELQDLSGQLQHESDGGDKKAQLGEGVSHIPPQSDLEMCTNDSVDREVQEGDPINDLLQNELSPQSISANDDNKSAAECSKEGNTCNTAILSGLYYMTMTLYYVHVFRPIHHRL